MAPAMWSKVAVKPVLVSWAGSQALKILATCLRMKKRAKKAPKLNL